MDNSNCKHLEYIDNNVNIQNIRQIINRTLVISVTMSYNNALEEVKEAAEEFMRKQMKLFSLMTFLDSKQMTEFREWFNSHPYNARLRGIPQSLP